MQNDMKTCVQNFLMAGYLYNASATESFLSDAEWDDLCRFIIKHWDEIDHPHKHLIKYDFLLDNYTAMYLTEDYLPSIVKHAARARANAPARK